MISQEKPDFQYRFFVILVRPENQENIGLVARAMNNTGFENLRLVGCRRIGQRAFATAVHAEDILKKASFYPDLAAATADLHIIFAATAKARKNFSTLLLEEAISKMFVFPSQTKIGLLFGNERTGLTSEELKFSNFRLTIPQASRQPSYNLASAVLITLFELFHLRLGGTNSPRFEPKEKPLPRAEQEECIQLILKKLEAQKFIHATNRRHVNEMVYDLFGRLAITDRDRKLLLALFSRVREGK